MTPAAPRFAWAGIAIGPAAWALNQGANYVLVPWTCANKLDPIPWVAAAFAVLALLGAYLSWRTADPEREAEPAPHAGGRPYQLLARIGMGAAVLFAAIILLQGLASLLIDSCAR